MNAVRVSSYKDKGDVKRFLPVAFPACGYGFKVEGVEANKFNKGRFAREGMCDRLPVSGSQLLGERDLWNMMSQLNFELVFLSIQLPQRSEERRVGKECRSRW